MGLSNQDIFWDDVIYTKFLRQLPCVFDMLFFATMLMLLIGSRNKSKRVLSNFEKIIFFLAVLSFSTILVNPNSSFTWVDKTSRAFTFMLLPFALYTLLKISDENLFEFLNVTFRYFAAFAIICSVLALVKFSLGNGVSGFFDVDATIQTGDVLYFLSFIQVILLALFLVKKRFLYLFLSSILLVTMFFSFRRTALAISLYASVLLFLYEMVGSWKRFAVALVSLFCFGLIFSLFQPDTVSRLGVYIERYQIILGLGTDAGQGLGSDSGHLFESFYSMAVAVSTFSFWGVGLGSSLPAMPMLPEYAELGVHNVYADLLMRHGAMVFGFFMFVFAIVVVYLFRLVVHGRKVGENFFRFKFSILLFFLGFLIALFFNATWFKFDYSKFTMLYSILVVLTLRVSSQNYGALLRIHST